MSNLRSYIGIDLGSTTTKAVVLNDAGDVIGRGITNSRSNYDVACQVVREEALVQTRFTLIRTAIGSDPELAAVEKPFLSSLVRNFRRQQHLDQLASLQECAAAGCGRIAPSGLPARAECRHRRHRARHGRNGRRLTSANWRVRKSDFFRDLATTDYMQLAEEQSDSRGITFDVLCSLFDAAILVVENSTGQDDFDTQLRAALEPTLATSGPRDEREGFATARNGGSNFLDSDHRDRHGRHRLWPPATALSQRADSQ